MSRDTWFKCDPTALLGGCEAIEGPHAKLVYVFTLMRIYEFGGRVPSSPGVIAAMCGLTPQATSRHIANLVELGKLIERDGYLHNPRADEELGARQTLSGKRSKAGKMGGRPKKSETPQPPPGGNAKPMRTESEANANAMRSECDPSLLGFGDSEMAENGGLEKANGKPRALAREREEGDRESSSPPLRSIATLPDRIPEFGDALEPDERSALRARLAAPPSVDRDYGDVDIGRLTGEIMTICRMVAPPLDLPLVGGWVKLGAKPDEIRDLVTRMSASARGPVRSMRYFDGQIRLEMEAKKHADQAFVQEMERIARRNRA